VRKDRIERDDGGTLFLDECGEGPPPARVRLLRIPSRRVVRTRRWRKTIDRPRARCRCNTPRP